MTADSDLLDIGQLQHLLCKDHDDSSSLPTTQLLSSSPAPLILETPVKRRGGGGGGGTGGGGFSLVDTPFQATTSGDTTFSHDRTGNLQLDLGYSQIDLGETQVDGPEMFEEYEEVGEEGAEVLVAHSPEPGEGTQLDDEDPGLRTTHFPGNSRFDTPRHPNNHSSSSPIKKTTPTPGPGYNPLAQVGFGRGGGGMGGNRLHTGPSLSQMFESTSSPVRPPTGGASLPPTPSKAQLERVMAESMSRLSSRMASRAQETVTLQEGPGRASKSQLGPTEVYVSMQESQEAREENARKKSARMARLNGGRVRRAEGGESSSPVVFNSSLPTSQRRIQMDFEKDKVDESDDGMISSEDERNRKTAAAARKKGVEEVKRVASFARVPKNNGLDRWRSKSREEPREKAEKKLLEILAGERESREGTPTDPDDETGDEEEEEEVVVPEPQRNGSNKKGATPEEKGLRLPRGSRGSSVPLGPVKLPPDTLIAATSSPKESQDLPAPTVPQTQPGSVFDWESIHKVEPLRAIRRTKSATSVSSSQQLPTDMPTLRHQKAYPSTIADSQPPVPSLNRQDTGMVKTSLRNLPPFNLPSPDTTLAKRAVLELVPETSSLEEASSGLPPPTSSLTPVPSTLPSPASGIQTSSPPPALKTPFHSRAGNLRRMKQGATTIPETSPRERCGMLSPVPPNASQSAPPTAFRPPNSRDNKKSIRESPVRIKRKRGHKEDIVPNSLPGDEGRTGLKSFAALDNSSSLLSSRPEPDDIDMADLMAGIRGDDANEELAPPVGEPAIEPHPPKRTRTSTGGDDGVTPKASKSRRKKAAGSKEKPQSARSTTTMATKKGKAPRKSIGRGSVNSNPHAITRKTRSSASFRDFAVGTIDSPTPTAAPESEDELESNNPVFSVVGSVPLPDPSIVSPERVFALFKDVKMCYHPATVLSTDSKGAIKVVFDDGTEDVLDKEVRSLDLRVGDMVKVDQPTMKKAVWVIVGLGEPEQEPDTHERVGGRSLTDIRGHTIVTVKTKVAATLNSTTGGEVMEIPLTRIYLNRTLWAQFSKRPYRDISLKSRVLPLRTATPPITGGGTSIAPNTPSRNRRNTPISVTAAVTAKQGGGGGMFFNMVFALSFGENESGKRSISNKIVSNGGRLVDSDFEEFFQDSDGGGGLAARPETTYVGFACVVADKHSRRVKFLQALALGLPCLAGRWVEDCVKKRKLLDWDTYLLPAGESAYLGGAIRSRTMPYVPAEDARFSTMVAGRGKLLQEMNVLLVTGKLAAGRWKPYLFLAYALGAAKVAKVPTLEAAVELLREETWEFVYVDAKDKKRAERVLKMQKGAGVVDDEWVIQSLILGKLIAGE